MEIKMKKIMLVDDNALSVEGIHKNIDWASLDAQIIHMEYSGASAIEAMKKIPVDIIISDIEMPDIDGISMSKSALSFNPFIKVILISAYDKFEYAKRAIRLGVYDYIEKPLDYKYLYEKIQGACALIDQEQHNMELLKASRPAMTEKFFLDLLHYSGKEASYHLSSHMQYLELDLDYRFFNVAIFNVENAVELKQEMSIQQYEILLYKLYDSIRNYCKIFDSFYLVKHFDRLELILCQNSSNANHFLQSIHKVAASVIEEYEGSSLSLNIGIGNIVSNLWNTHLSFESAQHALEYRFFFPQKNIFDTREAFGQNLSLEPFSDATEDELIKLICQKDYPALENWIKEFSSELLNKYRTKDFIFVRTYTLLGRLLKFLYELNIDTKDLEEKIANTYSRLHSFNTSEEFFAWLSEICTLACRKLDISLKTYHNQLCESVLGYIQDNYQNNDLCLQDIARFANVSPAYLSALFKKNMNTSISKTITVTRIEAACKYLESSNLTLKEISEKCGYANQYYFSTSFKKHKGISPSGYRK